MQKEHEIEIELNANKLIEQGRLAASEHSDKAQFVELVEGLVDNVRHLARKAKQFHPTPEV